MINSFSIRKQCLRMFFICTLPALILLSACSSKTPEEEFQEVQTLLQEQQFPLAIIKMREMIKENPEAEITDQVRMTLASVYIRMGREENMQKAIEQLEEIYKGKDVLQMPARQAHQMATEAMVRLGDLDGAIANVEDAIEGVTDELAKEELTLQKATLMLLKEDNEEAAQEGYQMFEEAMLNSEHEVIRHQAREVLANHNRQQQDFEKSNEVYSAYIERYPDDKVVPQLEMAMGLNLKQMEEDEIAEEVFRSGEAKMREQIEEELDSRQRAADLNNLALLLKAFQDLEGAEKVYREIMSEVPATRQAIEAQLAIGDMYAEARNWEKAQTLFEAMSKENPTGSIQEIAQERLQRLVNYRKAIEEREAQLAAEANQEENSDEAETSTDAPEAEETETESSESDTSE